MSVIKNCFFRSPDRNMIKSVYARQKNKHLKDYLSRDVIFRSYGHGLIDAFTGITGNWPIKRDAFNELNLYQSESQADVLSRIEKEEDSLTKLMNHQIYWARGSLLISLASIAICIALPIIFATPITSVPITIVFISALVLASASILITRFCHLDNSNLNAAIEKDNPAMQRMMP